MKNLLMGLLAALFLAVTGVAVADDFHHDDHGGAVVVVAPHRHYHYWHHRRYYYDEHHYRHYDEVAPAPRSGVSLSVGVHN